MSENNESSTENDSQQKPLSYRIPNLDEVEFEERRTFVIVQTDGQSTTVKGTRIVRPSDRDGLLVVDDNIAQEAGMDTYSDEAGDSYVVLAIPNATLKLAYCKEQEVDENVGDEWSADEELEI